MDFRLRKMCKDCPWRSDREYPFFGKDERGYERTQELRESLQGMHVFPCHKTAYFDDDGDQHQTERTQACAGVLITMEKAGDRGDLVQIAERIGKYDPSILDLNQPTYNSLEEWSEAHNPEGTQ